MNTIVEAVVFDQNLKIAYDEESATYLYLLNDEKFPLGDFTHFSDALDFVATEIQAVAASRGISS
jgi:hypothetical protein